MGITFANETIYVTGGSQDDPYTMADLDADGTVGGETFSKVLHAALCPNRLEFPWQSYHTGEEYSDPPREFFLKVTGNEVKRFFRRALIRLRHGKQVDKWDGFYFGKRNAHNDKQELPRKLRQARVPPRPRFTPPSAHISLKRRRDSPRKMTSRS